MSKKSVTVSLEICNKTWLNQLEAIMYYGFGNHNWFKEQRRQGLPFYLPEYGGRKILYKRKELDEWMNKRRFVDCGA